jgi:hypothetical protein
LSAKLFFLEEFLSKVGKKKRKNQIQESAGEKNKEHTLS